MSGGLSSTEAIVVPAGMWAARYWRSRWNPLSGWISHTTQVARLTQASSATGGPNSDNLAFESVDFSTRGAVIRNLPQRVFDLILRPYPWQLQDTSQRLGAVGSVIALAVLALLLGYAWRSRGQILTLTAPILYPLVFLLIAYSLSAGNAGTGFRYRTHLVVLAIAVLVVLREHVLRAREESEVPLSALDLAGAPLDSTLVHA